VRILTRTLLPPGPRPKEFLAQCGGAVSRTRAFSRTPPPPADSDASGKQISDLLDRLSSAKGAPVPRSGGSSRMGDLAQALNTGREQQRIADTFSRARNRAIDTSALDGPSGLDAMKEEATDAMGEYHLNVYGHKHNTYITVSKPNRDVILSLSTGNLGFKKAKRHGFDAAYQLGAYVMDRLIHQGWHRKIKNLEVVMRGYGPGREAVTKILLGSEGRLFRGAIRKVADNTKLKFGGTRSKKPRRLG